jgi:hypothetical protein
LSQHIVQRDHAGRAGLVLDDHRLAERNAQFLGDDARRNVARAARRKADHNADRTIGKILRGCRRRKQRKQNCQQAPHRFPRFHTRNRVHYSHRFLERNTAP